jgi:hypothetical protein
MDYAFALRFFAIVLAVSCLALVPLFVRRDPAPARHIVRIEVLPPAAWPGIATRIGTVALLGSFVLLVGTCYLLIVD